MSNLKIKSFLLALTLSSSLLAPICYDKINVKAYATEIYTVSSSIKRYSNAQDAANQVNSVGTYSSGTFYIYKTFNGMINISKNPNSPGSWINPRGVAPIKTTTTSSTTVSVPTTTTSKTTTTENKTSTQTTTKATTPSGSTSSKYAVNSKLTTSKSISGYLTADDAKNKKNSNISVVPGTYVVYKVWTNGMINISKTQGSAGYWINPSDLTLVETIPNKNTTPNKTTTPTKTTPNTTTTTTTNTNQNNTKLVVGGPYSIISSTPGYVTASDAYSKINSVKSVTSGKYIIYKIWTNGMINISTKAGVPGVWVNPSTVKQIETTTTTVEPTTTTKKQTTTTTTTTSTTVEATTTTKVATSSSNTTKIEPTTTTKIEPTTTTKTEVKLEVGKVFTLSKEVSGFSTALDAQNGLNSTKSLVPGNYYIYKIWTNGMINISKTAGAAGSWINPMTASITDIKTDPNIIVPKYKTMKADLTSYLPDEKTKTPDNPNIVRSISDLALKQLGKDGKEFYTYYGYTYRVEWCAIFASWLVTKTNNRNIIGTGVMVDDFTYYFKNKNYVTVNAKFRPQKDSIIVFDFNQNGSGDHVGIITGSDDKYIYTVEGNAHDKVSERRYDIDDVAILGYGLPAYPGAAIGDKPIKTGTWVKRLLRY